MKDVYNYLSIPIGFFAGVLAVGLAESVNFPINKIPNISQVQQGYIAPSILEIKCEDLDGNREFETIMKIGDVDYLLREIEGKPILSRYEIKPAQIQFIPAQVIPKEP
ncbi:hypothetical protein J4477_01345 [Candidatus Pacearchaeota archaeon]|nr:hypothetical protein [Candidatus Pacearchaeota archaeon]